MLRALSVEPDGLTPIELADRVGLPRSTAYRIVGTLTSEGLMRVSPGGKLSIGAGLIGIATAGRRDLRHEASPYLERLSHELHETVELVVLDGGEALFTNQFVSSRSLRVVAEVGDRFPLYCTACGKALLAELPRAEALRLIPRKLKPLTPHTNVNREHLLRELDLVRTGGVAYDHQEHTIGISAVGTAVRDAAGSVMHNIAEGFDSGTRAEFIRFLEIARRSVYEVLTALEIAQRLGYCRSEQVALLVKEADEIAAMISGLIKKLGER